MEKENPDMHRINPHLPAWRARLTAAALAGALGCAGGPTLLNVRFGAAPTVASESTPAPAVAARLERLRTDRGPGRGDGDYALGRRGLLAGRAFRFGHLTPRLRVASAGTNRLPPP